MAEGTHKLNILRFYLSPEGRIGRRTFWLRFMAPAWVLTFLVVAAAPPRPEPVMIFWAILLWPALVVGAKRCHDRNRPGWYQLIYLIPGIGPLWMLVELGVLPGTPGTNRYGRHPLASGS